MPLLSALTVQILGLMQQQQLLLMLLLPRWVS